MSPLLSQDWQLKGDGGMQCADCIGWNYGMRVALCQMGRKDYALLNAERMVYISFAINAFKFFLCY